jgi:anti-sigma regulatory factor (Ser/Thr protein kinase)
MIPEITLNIGRCFTHKQLVKELSPLFNLEAKEVKINIKINTSFIYPDFLLLVVGALRSLKEKGIVISGEIDAHNDITDYISRIDFFNSIDCNYNESFDRHDSKGRFIEIFNYHEKNVNSLDDSIINILTQKTEIEETVIQVLSFCLGEVLDNSLRHSTKDNGWCVAQYYSKSKEIRIMICDTGTGIHKSLTSGANTELSSLTASEALEKCIEKGVTNGDGMGFGLYATAKFAKANKGELIIYSGDKFLTHNQSETKVKEGNFWQGTFVFLKIKANNKVIPEVITDGYTDYIDAYNERFKETDIDSLW